VGQQKIVAQAVIMIVTNLGAHKQSTDMQQKTSKHLLALSNAQAGRYQQQARNNFVQMCTTMSCLTPTCAHGIVDSSSPVGGGGLAGGADVAIVITAV
jgi:hypothetical protein